MSGTQAPSATAADWQQWESAGNLAPPAATAADLAAAGAMMPPAAPVINNNPALDSPASGSALARLLAAQQVLNPGVNATTGDPGTPMPNLSGTDLNASAANTPTPSNPSAAPIAGGVMTASPLAGGPLTGTGAPLSPAVLAASGLATSSPPVNPAIAALQASNMAIPPGMQPGSTMPDNTPTPPIPPSVIPPAGPGVGATVPVRPAPSTPPTMPAVTPPAGPGVGATVPVPPTSTAFAPGDPTKVYGQVIGGESGGNNNAVNSVSGASGPAQFLPSTWAQFTNSPANTAGWKASDITNPTAAAQGTTWLAGQTNIAITNALGRPATQNEMLAGHMVGPSGAALMAANPNAPLSTLLSPAAIKNNAAVLSPGMTGTGGINSIANFYNSRTGPGALGAVGLPTAAATGTTAPTQNPSGATNDLVTVLNQLKGVQAPLPYPNAGDRPGGSQMLALAQGLLSGHSMADAFSKGFGALNNANLQQQEVQGKNNQEQAQLNQQQASLAQQAIAHQEMMAIMNGRLNLQTQKTNWQEDPAAQAAIGAAKASGSTEAQQTVKDNFKTAGEIDQAGIAANKNLPAMQNMLNQIDTSGAGPSVVSAFKRQVAMALGVPVGNTDPSSVQLVNAYNAMDQSAAAQAMKGLGLRTQNEFGVFIKGVGTIDNDPAVLKTLVQPLVARAQGDAQMYNDYHAMDPTAKAALNTTPNGVADWRSKYVQGAGASQGVRVNSPTNGAQAPTTQTKVINGITYTSTDGKNWSY